MRPDSSWTKTRNNTIRCASSFYLECNALDVKVHSVVHTSLIDYRSIKTQHFATDKSTGIQYIYAEQMSHSPVLFLSSL